MVVVVYMQARVLLPAFDDEVDDLLKRPLLVVPIERPESVVARCAFVIRICRVHDPEQVLQAVFLAVLRVVAGALDVEEQIAGRRRWQRGQAAVRRKRTSFFAFRLDELPQDALLVLTLDLQPRLSVGLRHALTTHAIEPRKLLKRGESSAESQFRPLSAPSVAVR